jgi:hypothetical protein
MPASAAGPKSVYLVRHTESARRHFATPVLVSRAARALPASSSCARPMEELFESRKLMLATYLAGAIRVRNLLGAQAVPWASRGADIFGRRGRQAIFASSEESLWVLLDLPGFRMGESATGCSRCC